MPTVFNSGYEECGVKAEQEAMLFEVRSVFSLAPKVKMENPEWSWSRVITDPFKRVGKTSVSLLHFMVFQSSFQSVKHKTSRGTNLID